MKSLLYLKIVGLLLTSLLIQRCATAYKPIHPDQMIFWDQQYIDPDSTVTINVVQHILGSNAFNKFVKAEKDNGVHMIALKIYNQGARDLHLPEDLEICLENGYSFYPMTRVESLNVLVPAEAESQWREIKIGSERSNMTLSISKAIPLVIPYLKLNKNMKDYYIESWVVSPGEEVAGILLLPIQSSSHFQVCLR